MTRVVQFIGGIPTTIDISIGSVAYYDQTISVTTNIGVSGTGYDSTHKIFTLPNSETYDGTKEELEVFIGGIAADEGIDYDYGVGTAETTITTTKAIPKDNSVRFRKVYHL